MIKTEERTQRIVKKTASLFAKQYVTSQSLCEKKKTHCGPVPADKTAESQRDTKTRTRWLQRDAFSLLALRGSAETIVTNEKWNVSENAEGKPLEMRKQKLFHEVIRV